MTDRTLVLRRALRASVVFNLVGGLAFAFPGSVGRLAGFPEPVPHLYSAGMALMVVLWAVLYAWLAARPIIDRPIVGLAAAGKSGFFAITVACWLAGEVPGLGVLTAGGDLVLAAIFVWGIAGEA
jgi:hypothetical protein